MEILKQAQYRPLPVEKQVVIIFAGTKGYLDDLPVEVCRKFEEELYRFVDNAHRGLWDEIREKKALDDALARQAQSRSSRSSRSGSWRSMQSAGAAG